MHIKQRMLSLLALGALIAGAGCASTPDIPDEELAMAETQIDQAEQAGARQYAAADLESAKERIASARAAANDDDAVQARRLATEAALDAELASAKSRSEKAEDSLMEIEGGIETLRQEIARNQGEQGGGQ
jgi:hypothetical protein